MVYLNKISSNKNQIVYSYGEKENKTIGTIEFENNDSKDLKEKNPRLYFEEGFSFNRTTSSALQAVSKFIRENNYPDNYLRATH